MSKYDFKLDLDSYNSLSVIISQIDKGKKILEFGPANGRLTRYLKEDMGCSVYIVECDKEAYESASRFAEDGVLGDIEAYEWFEKFHEDAFDYAIFADVLEHIRRPEKVIELTRKLLKDDGKIITSIPNVAHSAVIYNLLHSHFQYNMTGLLDIDHVHFFTYHSAKKLFEDNAMSIVMEQGLKNPDVNNEFLYHYDDANSQDTEVLEENRYGEVYQFVFCVVKNEYYEKCKNFLKLERKFSDCERKMEFSIYYDNGDGYNEEHRLRKEVKDGYNEYSFCFSEENHVKNVRIDFVEQVKCKVVISELLINGKKITSDNISGNYLGKFNREYLFDTIDPFIVVSFQEEIKEVYIAFQLQLKRTDELLAYYAEKIQESNTCKEHLDEKMKKEREELLKQLEDLKGYNGSLKESVKVLEGKVQVINQIQEALKDIYMLNEQLEKQLGDSEKTKQELVRWNNELSNQNMELTSQTGQLLNEKDQLVNEKDQLKSEKQQSENERQQLLNEKQQLLNEMQQSENERKELLTANNQLHAQVSNLSVLYSQILESTCWKVTKPVRVTLNGVKNILRKNEHTKLFAKGLSSVKRVGIKETMRLVRLRNNYQKSLKNSSKCEDAVATKDEIIPIDSIMEINEFQKTIAVHLHLYYEDLVDEFVSYFNHIPYPFDLYVSIRESANRKEIEAKLKTIRCVKRVDVRVTINRGRDIAPLYVQFGKEIEKYDYFMHVHSKKSLFSGKEQYGWRQYALDCLLGSEDIVRKIFGLFESDKKIGLFFPETFGEMHLIAHDWLANKANGKRLLEQMGIPFDDGLFNYPVGSFFWAKTDALRPLFDYKFKYEDFPEEAGQTDGTIAHALERVLPFVTRSTGNEIAIHDYENKRILIGRSLKIYQDYFALTKDAVQYHLSQFDLVSFDIFDTLITRVVYKPDDVFWIVDRRIKQEFNIELPFISVRKRAEALAGEKLGESVNIHDIYEQLPNVANISHDMAMTIKQFEIDTELEVCIPRTEMLQAFNHVKQNGKKIILVSDMYLTSEIIERMLKKCGYEGYDDIWISCEKGARKDSDTMWKLFFEKYGEYNTIHVGDNPRSDIQLVGDKLRRTFYIMNPLTAFKFSSHYNSFVKYMDTTIENSLMLGMMVNQGLYNSPFSVQANGEPMIHDSNDFGFVGIGALFTAFTDWLYKKNKDTTYLFLAREGYVFKALYEIYINNLFPECKERGFYFLASRRAISVASIRGREDVKGILSQYYKGDLTNCVKSRLGFDLMGKVNNELIEMPRDIDKVMSLLEPFMQEIMQQAKTEREYYLEYIKENLGQTNRLEVVDIGYSGTIQYYLAKVIEDRIDGNYLCTWVNKKPESIGCTCDALYPVTDPSEEFTSKIFSNQLLLEAIMQAPYGQFICFKKENGDLVPCYKEDARVPEEVSKLQEGIKRFVDEYSNLLRFLGGDCEVDKELAEDIFYQFSRGDWYDQGIMNALSVQDDYCSNGTMVFDKVEKKWVAR